MKTSINGAPIKSKASKGLYQFVPTQLRFTWMALGTLRTSKRARAPPKKKEPIKASIRTSNGFFKLLIPLPSKLPMIERTSIAARNSRMLVKPVPALFATAARLGNVIALARDRRNSNSITTTAFIARDPKFMSPPLDDKAVYHEKVVH
jgi:hypothetical protein